MEKRSIAYNGTKWVGGWIDIDTLIDKSAQASESSWHDEYF